MTRPVYILGSARLRPQDAPDPDGVQRLQGLPDLNGIPLTPRQKRQLGPVSAWALSAVKPLFQAHPPSPDLALIMALPLGCLEANAAFEATIPPNPRLFQSTVANTTAAWVAIAYGLTGPSITFTGPHAGQDALTEAAQLIAEGRVERAVAGLALTIPKEVAAPWSAQGGRPMEEVSWVLLSAKAGPGSRLATGARGGGSQPLLAHYSAPTDRWTGCGFSRLVPEEEAWAATLIGAMRPTSSVLMAPFIGGRSDRKSSARSRCWAHCRSDLQHGRSHWRR